MAPKCYHKVIYTLDTRKVAIARSNFAVQPVSYGLVRADCEDSEAYEPDEVEVEFRVVEEELIDTSLA